MLIVNPRASSMAPRQAEVIPFPKEETTPPVIKTYDVMCESVNKCSLPLFNNLLYARNKKGLEQKQDAFFQPFEFRAVVGLETVLNVIRQSPLMQCGTTNPAHSDTGSRSRIFG